MMKSHWWGIPLLMLFLTSCQPSPLTPTIVPNTLAQNVTSAPATLPATFTPTPLPTHTPTATPSPPPETFTPTVLPATTTPTTTPLPAPAPATPTATPSPEPIPPLAVVVTNANLRRGPGTNYPVIGTIAAGQQVFVRAQNPAGDWIQLDIAGDEQTWIAAFLLDLPAGLELPLASQIPPPPPTPTPGDAVVFSKSSITLPTYPWQSFLTPAYDGQVHWDYRYFDRAAYESTSPQPSPKSYELLSLENQWLRLTLLPDLGGRIYQMIFKPTGSNELYQNPVIKPSPWGPVAQGNGWVAAGGIEWSYPVPEHGYAWGEPWGYITELRPPVYGITVFDKGQDRVHLSIDVTLQPDSAAFVLDFLLQNPTDQTLPLSYWSNAMAAPGPTNTVGPDLYFLYPGQQIQIHSTGEPNLPGDGDILSWPVYNGRNLSRLGTWQYWLGFFLYPRAQAHWAAIYDMTADEGFVRIFPPETVPGLKGFGFGWTNPIDPHNYTDDNSAYVELHGGLTPTFAENFPLAPGAHHSWSETWYPLAGIAGISQADVNGAANLVQAGDGWHLRLFSISTRQGILHIQDANQLDLQTPLFLDPAHPADLLLPAIQPPLSFDLQTEGGNDWRMSDISPFLP